MGEDLSRPSRGPVKATVRRGSQQTSADLQTSHSRTHSTGKGMAEPPWPCENLGPRTPEPESPFAGTCLPRAGR